jgi:hypothetical protein
LADASRKRLYPASFRKAARSPREVMRMGSTVLILNGSMIVLKGSGMVMLLPARGRLLLGPIEPLADPLEEVFDRHLGDPVKQSAIGDLPEHP